MTEAGRQELEHVVLQLAELLELPARMSVLETELRSLRAEIAGLRRSLPPTLVPLPAAAKLLGVSLSTLRRRVKSHEVPVVRVGRSVRIDVAALQPPTEGEVAHLVVAARRDRQG